jgi:hypothetical protein
MESDKPRKLTTDEIKDILKIIPNIKSAADTVSEYNSKSLKQSLREQLEEIEITPLGIQDLKDEIIRNFKHTEVTPGEMVGMSTASSAASKLTQMLLNSHRVSGTSKNISSGMDRINELINASQITKKPSATIYFKNQFLSFDDIIIQKRPEFTEITVKDIVIGIPEIITTAEMEEPFWYSFYNTFYNKKYNSNEMLRLILDVNLLYAYKLTMENVVRVIEKDQPVICVFSPMSVGIIDIYPIEKEITSKLKNMQIISYEKAPLVFLSMIVIPALDKLKVSGITGIDQIFPVSSPVLQIVKEESKIEEVENGWFLILNPIRIRMTGITPEKMKKLCEVCGIEVLKVRPNYLVVKSDVSPLQRIKSLISQDEKEEKESQRSKTQTQTRTRTRREPTQIGIHSKLVYADTSGANLKELLSHPDVDSRRTYSNDLHEIASSLGIEAARSFLIKEFIDLLNDAGYINPVHIELLVDYMTNLGKVYGITFTGISRQPVGALEKASFQKAMKVFKDASGFGESKPVTGTSASIFVGRKALVGTGFNENYIKPENLSRYYETRKQLLENTNLVLDIGAFNDVIENMNIVAPADVAILEGAEEEMFGNLGATTEPEYSDRGFLTIREESNLNPNVKAKVVETPIESNNNILIKGPNSVASELLQAAEKYNVSDVPCPVVRKEDLPTSHVESGKQVSESVPILPVSVNIPPVQIPKLDLPSDLLEEMEKLRPPSLVQKKPEIKARPVKTFNLEEFMK